MPQSNMNRRNFLQVSASLSAGIYVAPGVVRASKSPNEKLNLAIIGCGHKGKHNLDNLTHENIAVLCDIDTNYLDKAASEHSDAKKYRDYREMLEKEDKAIDAVVVSTADHNHAPATIRALDMGKHVYCEKPLTHTVSEARKIAEKATEKKVVTQMGTQIHATDNYRRVVELIKSKAIGEVKEVYHWCNKGWSNGRFQTTDKPVPENLDWDLFLGPAKDRAYSPNVHPSNWRRFWQYGAGTFGDMACHIMDLSFWALDLTHPTRVKAVGPEIHPDGCPEWCMADYDFPAIQGRGALKVHWADGGHHHDLVKNTKDPNGKPLSNWGIGVLFVGEKGMLAANYGQRLLLPAGEFEGFTAPAEVIPKSIGHWKEFTEAIRGNGKTLCNFPYSGRLTETVLLGTVAFRTGKELQWDAQKVEATNVKAAEEFVNKDYRSGWEV